MNGPKNGRKRLTGLSIREKSLLISDRQRIQAKTNGWGADYYIVKLDRAKSHQ